jgi:hypothetical protein
LTVWVDGQITRRQITDESAAWSSHCLKRNSSD